MFLISSLIQGFNSLLPFTNPQTPLAQDILHTIALCTLLYYAPQLTDRQAWTPFEDTQQPEGPQHPDNTIVRPGLRRRRTVPGGFESELDEEEETPINPPPGEDEDEDLDQFEELDQALEDPFADPIEADEAAAGPADGHANMQPQGHTARTPRSVGAKKAKSLARKDQRRAYHEFMRSQGEAQRARDAEGAEEREEALFEEKRRRAVAEMKLEDKARKEREEKKAAEQQEREKEWEKQRKVLGAVRENLDGKGAVDLRVLLMSLGKDIDLAYAERLVKTSGLLGRKAGGELIMLTGSKWVVKVDQKVMDGVYQRAAGGETAARGDGKVTWDDMGLMLEDAIMVRAKS